jgi:hypothetical protein
MNKKFQRFQKEFSGVDLAKYFNLCSGLTIQHTVDDSIHLRICYKKSDPCPFLPLPLEILREIQTYLNHKIELFVQIDFPLEYPFVGPVWSLIDIQHTVRGLLRTCWHGEMTLHHYYHDKINEHNHYYNLHWTPAITISSDILEFVRRVNHFDEIFSSISIPN